MRGYRLMASCPSPTGDGVEERIRAAADELRRSPEMAEMYRPIKKPVTLRLDADVIAWFKAQGRGYQTRINRALRAVMLGERKG